MRQLRQALAQRRRTIHRQFEILALVGSVGGGQSDAQFIPAVPGKIVIQGRANDRMPERVASASFLEDVHPQRTIQYVEECRENYRRFQCRRSGAELAQGYLRSVYHSGQPQYPAQGFVHERQSHPGENASKDLRSRGERRRILTVFVRRDQAAAQAKIVDKFPDEQRIAP